MSTPSPWVLPHQARLGGRAVAIHTDYRDVLQIIAWLNGAEGADLPPEGRWYVAMRLFYPGFDALPRALWQPAAEYLAWFLAGGRPQPAAPGPRLLDWQQDAPLIVAGVNRAAGQDVRAMPYLHWWSFLACFDAIGEGSLSTVVAIRDKLRRGKKLEPWELEFYRTHRGVVDLPPRPAAGAAGIDADADAAQRARLLALLR